MQYIKSKKRGKGKASDKASSVCQLHLVITRPSGDTERYKIGAVPNMYTAIRCRKAICLGLRPSMQKKVA